MCVSYSLPHFIFISLSLLASFTLMGMLVAVSTRYLSLDFCHQSRERTLPTYPGSKNPGKDSDTSCLEFHGHPGPITVLVVPPGWSGRSNSLRIENSMEVPQKIKNRTTTQSSNSTLGYLSKENKNTNSKRYMHPSVHYSTIYKSQDIEAI